MSTVPDSRSIGPRPGSPSLTSVRDSSSRFFSSLVCLRPGAKSSSIMLNTVSTTPFAPDRGLVGHRTVSVRILSSPASGDPRRSVSLVTSNNVSPPRGTTVRSLP